MEQNKICIWEASEGRTPVALNDRMQIFKVILTGGQIHDSEPAISLLKGIKIKGKKILANKA